MNCLQNLPRSCARPSHGFKSHTKKPSGTSFVCLMNKPNTNHLRQSSSLNVTSGPSSDTKMSDSGVEEVKSEIYSNNMTQAMGAVLTYRHELGMNYNFICPDLIVGSCLQSPEDVDKLRKIGVKTIFCLQQDSDLEYPELAKKTKKGTSPVHEAPATTGAGDNVCCPAFTGAYFSVDITAIQQYVEQFNDIEHLRARIRDFDAFDLRLRLPAVVSKLYKAINRNGGVTYIHCTAGLGRAPAVALAYMFWVQGYKLSEARNLLLSKRPCFPKLDAIRSATADILTGLAKKHVTLMWGGKDCSSVEISGLDIGWGQRIPLTLNEKGQFILERELPEGHYEYKYVIDGEWTCNKYELVTQPNKDGHVNNYVNVTNNDPNSASTELRKRLSGDDANLTQEERVIIRQFLEAYSEDEGL